MKAKSLLLSLLVICALVACETKPPQPSDPGPDNPGDIDYIFYSNYGYLNRTKHPVSVDFHASNYGMLSRESESFIVYPGDKYELSFCGFGIYIGPFGLGVGGDISVTVSNGEKQFTHRGGDKFAYLINPCMYSFLNKEADNKKIYEYSFTDEDFDNAEQIESRFNVQKENNTTQSLYSVLFGFVNNAYSPITVEYHSADYGNVTLPKSEKFTVYQNDKYELSFTGYDDFPNPFSASVADDYVKVSNGKKEVILKFGDGGYLFKTDSYKLKKDIENFKVYEYIFTEADFENAKPME